jgi:hypothetical protein
MFSCSEPDMDIGALVLSQAEVSHQLAASYV